MVLCRKSLALPFQMVVERVLHVTDVSPFDELIKGGYPIGRITTRKDGSRWKKVAEGKWVKVKGKGGSKAEEGGPKYVRKKKDKAGKWKYVYSEAGLAHKAEEGEVIHLGGGRTIEITAISQRGKHSFITYVDDNGTSRTDTASGIHRVLHEAYGERFERAAIKVAQRWGRAAQRLEGINKLALHGEDGRLARAVYDRLQSTMTRTKTDAGWSASLSTFIVQRRKEHGWSGSGTLAVMQSLDWGDGKHAPTIAANIRQIIQAAENLAKADGQDKVTDVHVAAALAKRWPDAEFSDDSFGAHVATVETALAEENTRLSTALDILENAAQHPDHAVTAVASFVKGVVDLQSGPAMRRMAEAFPGLSKSESLQSYMELTGRTKAILDAAEGSDDPNGSECQLFIADVNGHAKPHRARYKVIEAADLIASHQPTKGFSQNPAYPEDVQERPYHQSKKLQENVHDNSHRFHPALVHNTNPDSVNGPPIVTTDNVALGGNSRAMAQQLSYDSGRGDAIKSHLAENSHKFGISAAVVNGMKQPVLVRELAGMSASETPQHEMRELVRRANEAFTMSMDPRSMDVARANRVNDSVVQALVAGMRPDETLNTFLSSNRGASKEFLSSLYESGIIDKRNADAFVSDADKPEARLNADGRRMVGRMFVGKMVPDADLLGEVPPSLVGGLAMSAPAILAAGGHGEEHSLAADLKVALRTYVDNRYAHAAGVHVNPPGHVGALDEAIKQSQIPGFNHPIATNERAQELYRVLAEHSGERDMPQVFKAYHERVKHASAGAELALLGAAPTSSLEHLTTAREGWAATKADQQAARAHGKRQKARGKLLEQISTLKEQADAATDDSAKAALTDKLEAAQDKHRVLSRESREHMNALAQGRRRKRAGGYVITLQKAHEKVIAVGRHGGQITGYQGGDQKKPIYLHSGGGMQTEQTAHGGQQGLLFSGGGKETTEKRSARQDQADHHIRQHEGLDADLKAKTGRYFATRDPEHKRHMHLAATAHDKNLIDMARALGLPQTAEHAKGWMKKNADHVARVRATTPGTQTTLFGVPAKPRRKYKSGAQKRKEAAARRAKDQGSLF